MLYLFVFAQLRTQNRFPLLLGLLYIGVAPRSARGPAREAQDGNFIYMKQFVSVEARFLSRRHPAREAQDLGKVGRAVGIGRRWLGSAIPAARSILPEVLACARMTIYIYVTNG